MTTAVAQQFHSSAWRSRASDNYVTRWPNERNVEGRHDFIAAVRRAGRNHRGGCGFGFNWCLLFVREAEDKCRTTCRSKREKREGYSAYRYGGHGTQPVAKSLARQCPLKSWCADGSQVIKSAHPDHAACEATPGKFGEVGGGCPGLVAGAQLASECTQSAGPKVVGVLKCLSGERTKWKPPHRAGSRPTGATDKSLPGLASFKARGTRQW